MANTIQLIGGFEHKEDVGYGSIKPGMLLEVFPDYGDRLISGFKKVRAHSTPGGFSERAFAVEDALQGRTVDDAYTAGDIVSYHLAAPGSVVNALLEVGVDYAIGDKLVSAGDGALQKLSGLDSDEPGLQVIAVVEEAISLNDSGDVDTLVPVRVL